MELYSQDKNYKLFHGQMQDMESVVETNSIDSIVCDPPYELNFMGKGWDNAGVAFDKEAWKHCFNVLKPGGYLLAFGGSRTFHRIACAIEDAGFEIRDCIMWLYGSGFPKSMNIGLAIDKKNGVESIDTGVASPNARPNSTKDNTLFESGTVGKNFNIKVATNEWNGWGTCLKPAFEPIIIARKPFKGSLVDNVIEYGVGGLNIDECRVGEDIHKVNINDFSNQHGNKFGNGEPIAKLGEKEVTGRFPANVILTYDESDYEEVCGGFPNTKGSVVKEKGSYGFCFQKGKRDSKPMADGYNDEGSAARYFYCAKASKKDRDEGLEDFEEKEGHAKGNGLDRVCEFCGASQLTPELCHCETKSWVAKPRKNIHPTVKPTQLMQYLVRLVTPKGGTVMDCFMGSGSTGKAVMFENKERNANYKFIGIEMTDEYLPICEARIKWADSQEQDYNLFNMGENE